MKNKIKVYFAQTMLTTLERDVLISSDLQTKVIVGWWKQEDFMNIYKNWVRGNYNLESSPFEELFIIDLPKPMKFKSIIQWLNHTEKLLPMVLPEELEVYMKYIRYYNSVDEWLKEVQTNAQYKEFITG